MKSTYIIHNKKAILFLILFVSSLGVFAQKEVRKDIRKGNKLYEQKLYNTAEANYKAALEKNESSPEALFNLGNTYYEEGKWDDALKEYQKYLEVEKKNSINLSGAWHNLGNAFLRKNDLDKSQAAYKQALRLNPNDDETRYNLVVVNKMLEEKNKQNQDKNQDKQDQDKDKKDQDKDEQKDKDKQNQDKKDQDKHDQDKGKDQQEQNQGISPDNMEQLLQAIEQDEKSTQDKVQQMKAAERKKQNENNRRLNKDW